MAKLIFRQEGIDDITDIWDYTTKKWSEEQADKYYGMIKTALKKSQLNQRLVEVTMKLILTYLFQRWQTYHFLPNRGSTKVYDKVAGCLIAFACRQSFINDKEGYLAFDVSEEKKEDEIKLMNLYSQKYNALRLEGSNTMIILPEGCEKLINDFLKQKIMKKTEILPTQIWNDDKINSINEIVKKHSENQSKEQKIRYKLLSIQYKLEEYIDKDDIQENEVLDILDFVKMYLKALDITKRDLARYFGMRDSNLHKYLTGKRKLNSEVVLKISSFSRTKPEYWYRVQLKNEIVKLNKERTKDYEKYDYKKLLAI